jgi:hypothetical protein
MRQGDCLSFMGDIKEGPQSVTMIIHPALQHVTRNCTLNEDLDG